MPWHSARAAADDFLLDIKAMNSDPNAGEVSMVPEDMGSGVVLRHR